MNSSAPLEHQARKAPSTTPEARHPATQPRLDTPHAAIGMPRYLRSVQRDGPQLTPPSLLQPVDPMARYRFGPTYQLRMSPEMEALLNSSLARDLAPGRVAASLGRINPGAPAATPAGAGSTAPGGTTPTEPSPATEPATPSPSTPAAPNPAAAAPSPAPAPVVPPGAGPATPRPATAGDVMSAISQVPAVQRAVTALQTTALNRARTDWRQLSTGERAAVVTSGVTIGAGLLGGVLSQADTRDLLLRSLNGRIWPVPGVDGLRVELRFQKDIMVGFHFDVGRYLPRTLGFGPSSPRPIGGPPQPEPFVPGQRDAQGDAPPRPAAAASGSRAQQIENAATRGTPIAPALHNHLENALERRIPEMRVHTDGQAHELAESLTANAFVSGRDVFFRSGAYRPDSPEGLKLLTHEAAHVAQQNEGRVGGTPTADGVAVSHPDDSFEREARRLADRTSELPLYLRNRTSDTMQTPSTGTPPGGSAPTDPARAGAARRLGADPAGRQQSPPSIPHSPPHPSPR